MPSQISLFDYYKNTPLFLFCLQSEPEAYASLPWVWEKAPDYPGASSVRRSMYRLVVLLLVLVYHSYVSADLDPRADDAANCAIIEKFRGCAPCAVETKTNNLLPYQRCSAMRETHLRQGRQTVKLGLIKVITDLFPGERLKTAYSIQEGVFCKLTGSLLSEREVRQIGIKLQEWVDSKRPIHLLYKKDGYYHYNVDNTIVKALYPANINTSMVEPFAIIPFATGFIVSFLAKAKDRTALVLPKKLSATYQKSQQWLSNIGLELAGDVNAQIRAGRSHDLISIAEALQEKEIADIADMILIQRRAIRVVLISGPSSSGKTTFSQRLATQLRVNGLNPKPLSLDNYFVNRTQTPLDRDGKYDFESLKALDLKFLQKHLKQLIAGETVETPRFDFVSGCRAADTIPMSLGPDEVLIIEGLHALNPQLTSSVQSSTCFKVYIGALFELNIDPVNRVPTTEVRLLRRIVRDDRFRGINPEETIERWDSVRRGEYKNIFKFYEEADVMFNSSLVYEMNALRTFAESALHKIRPDSPHYPTKNRLLNLLSFFEPLDLAKVPFNSILREFIGESIYHYE